MAAELFKFESAIRGYHFYKKYWVPVENQKLDCAHEVGNPYDFFAIKTCESGSGRTVGHLPMEISRPIKFLLQRGAVIKSTLSSTSYRRSPLVQGGLEIPCQVSISMPATCKNNQIIEKFKEMVDVLYVVPDGSAVIGSFLHHTVDNTSVNKQQKKRKFSKDSTEGAKAKETVKDIRSFFEKKTKKSTVQSKKMLKPVIEID